MKYWGLLTVVCYLILMAAMLWPLAGAWLPEGDAKDFRNYWFAPILAAMCICQILLLVVPIRICQQREVPQRKLSTSIVTFAFLLAALVAAGCGSILAAVFGDAVGGHPVGYVLGFGVPLIFSWVAWMALFHLKISNPAPQTLVLKINRAAPQALVKKMIRYLYRGSILELLIAVPSHVIVRQRKDCCAHGMTFVGIVTGLAVGFLSFGPALFLLFAERRNQMLPKSQRKDAVDPAPK